MSPSHVGLRDSSALPSRISGAGRCRVLEWRAILLPEARRRPETPAGFVLRQAPGSGYGVSGARSSSGGRIPLPPRQ